MFVFTKILSGLVQHRSYDLVDKAFQTNGEDIDENPSLNDLRLDAVAHSNKILRTNDVTYLTPEKGNIHNFSAKEDTIVFDVLFPSYNELFCNYYEEVPQNMDFKNQCAEEKDCNNQTTTSCLNSADLNESQSHNVLFPTNKKVILAPVSPSYDLRIRMLMYQGEPIISGI